MKTTTIYYVGFVSYNAGCFRSSNRLGLGTNLYSGEKTLAEKYGLDYLNVELLKDSKLYRKKLLYGNK